MLSDDTKTYDWLTVCSAYSSERASGPLLQPKYTFTYLSEIHHNGNVESLDDPLLLTVCGPCARSCLNMEHVKVFQDNIAYLSKPFVCQCSRITKSIHSCCWSGSEVPAPQGVPSGLREAWAEQAHHFLASKKQAFLDKLLKDTREHEPSFTQKLRSSMEMFAQYFDPLAQDAAVKVIPVSLLVSRATAAFDDLSPEMRARTDSRDELFKQLLFWFKDQFFRWVDAPQCPTCGGPTASHGSKSLTPNPEEVANWAATVEGYVCTGACAAPPPTLETFHQGPPPSPPVIRLPRYNRATRLLTWRKGRCGEWTNCFLLLAISLGFECRYVLDFTDHVWVEVYSFAKKRWVHADPCENAFDTPFLYEDGWKKNLTYIFAFSHEECVDVVRRYSRHSAQLSQRRTVSESFLQGLVTVLDCERAERITSDRAPLMKQRRCAEVRELYMPTTIHTSVDLGAALQGRTTGSASWRRSREEDGESKRQTDDTALGGVEADLRAVANWNNDVNVLQAFRSLDSNPNYSVAPPTTTSGGLVVKGKRGDLFSPQAPTSALLRSIEDPRKAKWRNAQIDTHRGFTMTAHWQPLMLDSPTSSFTVSVGSIFSAVVSTEDVKCALTSDNSPQNKTTIGTRRLSVKITANWFGTYRGGSPPSHSYCEVADDHSETAAPTLEVGESHHVAVTVAMDHLGGLSCSADIIASFSSKQRDEDRSSASVPINTASAGLLVPLLHRTEQSISVSAADISLTKLILSAAIKM